MTTQGSEGTLPYGGVMEINTGLSSNAQIQIVNFKKTTSFLLSHSRTQLNSAS